MKRNGETAGGDRPAWAARPAAEDGLPPPRGDAGRTLNVRYGMKATTGSLLHYFPFGDIMIARLGSLKHKGWAV